MPPQPYPLTSRRYRPSFAHPRPLRTARISGKWNKETNEGLNDARSPAAQTEGKAAGLYKGALDNKYGNGTAHMFAISAAANNPQGVSPAFLKAMNDMAATGALKTVYRPELPQKMMTPPPSVTVAAEKPVVAVAPVPVVASNTPTQVTPVETTVADNSTRTTGSAARDINGDADFNVASIKPAFTMAANGITPTTPELAPAGPVVVQKQ